MTDATLQHWQAARRTHIEQRLNQALAATTIADARLREAMHYSLLAGGKRLRPLLVYATAETMGLRAEQVDSPAMAVEAMHTYSLVHDDLPSMDDDDLRRGQPTCHKAFDEATAILAGDALLTLAFDWLGSTDFEVSDATRLACIRTLSRAAGGSGMVAGQMIDLQAEGQARALDDTVRMHRLKTGALIVASVQMGALVAGADHHQLAALTRYGEALGLAFQVIDDVLDVTGHTEHLGKPAGSDAQNHKTTFVSLLGLEPARHYAERCISDAKQALHDADLGQGQLHALADFVLTRSH